MGKKSREKENRRLAKAAAAKAGSNGDANTSGAGPSRVTRPAAANNNANNPVLTIAEIEQLYGSLNTCYAKLNTIFTGILKIPLNFGVTSARNNRDAWTIGIINPQVENQYAEAVTRVGKHVDRKIANILSGVSAFFSTSSFNGEYILTPERPLLGNPESLEDKKLIMLGSLEQVQRYNNEFNRLVPIRNAIHNEIFKRLKNTLFQQPSTRREGSSLDTMTLDEFIKLDGDQFTVNHMYQLAQSYKKGGLVFGSDRRHGAVMPVLANLDDYYRNLTVLFRQTQSMLLVDINEMDTKQLIDWTNPEGIIATSQNFIQEFHEKNLATIFRFDLQEIRRVYLEALETMRNYQMLCEQYAKEESITIPGVDIEFILRHIGILRNALSIRFVFHDALSAAIYSFEHHFSPQGELNLVLFTQNYDHDSVTDLLAKTKEALTVVAQANTSLPGCIVEHSDISQKQINNTQVVAREKQLQTKIAADNLAAATAKEHDKVKRPARLTTAYDDAAGSSSITTDHTPSFFDGKIEAGTEGVTELRQRGDQGYTTYVYYNPIHFVQDMPVEQMGIFAKDSLFKLAPERGGSGIKFLSGLNLETNCNIAGKTKKLPIVAEMKPHETEARIFCVQVKADNGRDLLIVPLIYSPDGMHQSGRTDSLRQRIENGTFDIVCDLKQKRPTPQGGPQPAGNRS